MTRGWWDNPQFPRRRILASIIFANHPGVRTELQQHPIAS